MRAYFLRGICRAKSIVEARKDCFAEKVFGKRDRFFLQKRDAMVENRIKRSGCTNRQPLLRLLAYYEKFLQCTKYQEARL